MILSSLKSTLQMCYSTLDTFQFNSLACVKFTIPELKFYLTVGLDWHWSVQIWQGILNKTKAVSSKQSLFLFLLERTR